MEGFSLKSKAVRRTKSDKIRGKHGSKQSPVGFEGFLETARQTGIVQSQTVHEETRNHDSLPAQRLQSDADALLRCGEYSAEFSAQATASIRFEVLAVGGGPRVDFSGSLARFQQNNDHSHNRRSRQREEMFDFRDQSRLRAANVVSADAATQPGGEAGGLLK